MNWPRISQAYLEHSEEAFVLVTLVSTKGASYFKPGARMLANDSGSFWGSISAGCLEEKVAVIARECISNRQHQLLTIDTRPHYGCYGEITLLLEVLHNPATAYALMQEIATAQSERRALMLATNFTDFSQPQLTRLIKAQIVSEELYEEILPPIRLMIFGNWPDGRVTNSIAESLGWDCHLVDTSKRSFSIEQELHGFVADSRTAVVLMSHHLAREVVCLKSLLGMDFGYFGVIGSRSRREALNEEVLRLGSDELVHAFEQVSCPVGLDLGGSGPQAIALSVVAEIQAVMHGKAPQA